MGDKKKERVRKGGEERAMTGVLETSWSGGEEEEEGRMSEIEMQRRVRRRREGTGGG